MAIIYGQFQCSATDDDKPHSGYAFQALARRRNQGIERYFAHIDGNHAVGAHGVDNQAPPARGYHGSDFWQRVEDARAGFAMHLGDMAAVSYTQLDVYKRQSPE